MAMLINCSVCGKEISSAAKSCPHCGNPGEAETEMRFLQSNGYAQTKRCIRCGELAVAKYVPVLAGVTDTGSYICTCCYCNKEWDIDDDGNITREGEHWRGTY